MNKELLQVLGLRLSPNIRYLSKCFAEMYRAQYENAMLVYLRGTPLSRPENSVNILELTLAIWAFDYQVLNKQTIA